jgi:hypothetical protein
MRGIECVGNLDGQRQNQLGFHRSPGDAMLQRQPIQKFHGDERFTVLVVNFVDGADVRMIQGRSRLGFALKAAECLRVFGYVVGEELEGHKAAEFDILCFVNNAIPPPPSFSTMR